MKEVVIDNPILNSPFVEPTRHFKFSEEGITDEDIEGRRVSSYFVPIARPRKKGKSAQLTFDSDWPQDQIQENKFINRVRGRVSLWRQGGYVDTTKATARLLEYWTNPEREKKLFFCQIEALETAIYIAEVAKKYGDGWIESDIRHANEQGNSPLFRIAFKMATGSGKTVVMAMLISWHVLNKLANPSDPRFSDAFLIVTPGITIRDRLRVLLPNDPQNYYRQWNLLPPDQQGKLEKAKILITNFHAFKPREQWDAAALTKAILSRGESGLFTETPDQMVRRVCRDLGNKRNIVVINDEAHHCYRRKADGEDIKLKGDERKEAEKREEEARIWISGLEAVREKVGVRTVCDLSATPFFLRGSGYPEATLFPWVVSDFSLIDAIECGIVKVPRVPVADDQMQGDQPTYRDLWLRIREHLPKKGRATEAVGGEPHLPKELQGALHSLYGNYEKYYRLWESNSCAREKGQTPPVFIVVCNNTNVSKLVCDYIAGWEKSLPDGSTVVVPGQLPIFSNEENGRWRSRPNTILIDSAQLESGDAMSAEFKKLAAREIEEFKSEYRLRFPGRDTEKLTDEDLLREVMNTVGKPGKLGEQVKCVVSVSMLTEGWDANTVTHILGVRAFGTQLLCEQVVGRGLRRISHAVNAEGRYEPEYAEVYGVPFSFIPCSGSTEPPPRPEPTHVRALEERMACDITFPRLMGYRYDLPGERLSAKFTKESKFVLSTADIPTKVQLDPIVGESSEHTLDDLKRHRAQEVAFLLAKRTLENYFRDDDGNVKSWLFPQLLAISKRWLSECVVLKDNTFPQLLLLSELSHDAADRIYKAIVQSNDGEKALKPILHPYDTIGSTRYVDFETIRPVYTTHPDRCHINYVVADTDSWEQKMAQALEDMDEVICYAKNHNLGFTIPYTINGREHSYVPDFIVRIRDPKDERADLALNLVIEVSGEQKKDKAAKVSTARTLWIPAVNNHGGFGRWAFLEITDPWNAMNSIREALSKMERDYDSDSL
ncbi:MAG: restriction endonuclease subunit R [Candidatus Abyssobacteria bacterium SURF_17]|uniref:Restriction endonuclease subunit R n=1 Tax=Candidatus Abyssobacteria bacterium SURF_17 TaxID=2093361 RepID=A0A419EVU0_9BACT|nr:MAG: restriction endonuclease subunit R [Candidatus Abyssubacteria bacterium SURF_17]